MDSGCLGNLVALAFPQGQASPRGGHRNPVCRGDIGPRVDRMWVLSPGEPYPGGGGGSSLAEVVLSPGEPYPGGGGEFLSGSGAFPGRAIPRARLPFRPDDHSPDGE